MSAQTRPFLLEDCLEAVCPTCNADIGEYCSTRRDSDAVCGERVHVYMLAHPGSVLVAKRGPRFIVDEEGEPKE